MDRKDLFITNGIIVQRDPFGSDDLEIIINNQLYKFHMSQDQQKDFADKLSKIVFGTTYTEIKESLEESESENEDKDKVIEELETALDKLDDQLNELREHIFRKNDFIDADMHEMY